MIPAVSLREWPCACKNAARRARAEKLRRAPVHARPERLPHPSRTHS
jgi:hypothetical protein